MFDWDDLRYVLAIARHGTLSSAARRLAVTQPTMGRRLDAFEKHLGTRLFLRTPEGFQLTAAGRELLAHAERMEGEALVAPRSPAEARVTKQQRPRLNSLLARRGRPTTETRSLPMHANEVG